MLHNAINLGQCYFDVIKSKNNQKKNSSGRKQLFLLYMEYTKTQKNAKLYFLYGTGTR